jgi:hypothetical protein
MRRIVYFLLLTGWYQPAATQYYFYNSTYLDPPIILEAGLSMGGMNCFTDLGGKKGLGKPFIKDLNIKNTQFCGGAYLHAFYHYVWGFRLEFSAGNLTTADSVLKNDKSVAEYRYKRNLHFRTTITEITAIAEWHFLAQLKQSRQYIIPLASPYLLAGVGIFHFNPEACINNRWVLLQPLHTEGQGFKEYPNRPDYKLTQVNFPVGLGIRYDLSALLNLRLEIIHRILLTDYLDDVSTRYIDPSLFDQYFDAGKAALAQKLADRRSELFNSPAYLPGQRRGDPSDKDAFLSINVKLGLVLNRSRRR